MNKAWGLGNHRFSERIESYLTGTLYQWTEAAMENQRHKINIY
jgi:hypothetical protein